MRSITIIFFLISVALCRNLKTVGPNLDLVNQQQQIKQLQELNELTKKIEESGDYSSLAVPVEAVDEDELSLYIYTKAQPAGTEIKLRNANVITQVSPFNTELKTIIYFHGWLDSFDSDHCILVRNAVLEAADVNIVMVNWDKYSKTIDYIESAANVAEIGKYVAEFILNVVETYSYSLSDITVVGHSLGAHIAGHVGKNTNGALGMIVGLDPAGPLFFKDIRSGRLTEDDAQYVHAIHTNAGVAGVTYSVGDSDFWPNGGAFQPCLTCSHNDAFRYYAESITNNLFFARQCDSYDNFQDGKCAENPKSMMGGINIDTSAAGNYYLKTNSESPYGMGDIVFFNKHN